VIELDKAWHEVSLGTISKCFKKAGICKDEGVQEDWVMTKFHCLTWNGVNLKRV
jgi:hypothetical protein